MESNVGVEASAVDLSGGLDESREYFFPECPTTPGMRDSASMWVYDDRGEVCLPRFGIEAMAPRWDVHDLQVNVAFADGRVYRLRDSGPAWPAQDPDGRAGVLGAGPLVLRCVEPFRSWTASFEGTAVETSTATLLAGNNDGPRTDLEFHVDAEMAVPAWEQGGLFPEAAALIESSTEAQIVQGRYEQLFRATGMVRVRGEEHRFSGIGVRVRRQATRPLLAFRGNILASALFPSGRAFACIVHWPRSDGVEAYDEGYVFEGHGSLVPARVVKAPWMSSLRPAGEDATIVLESALGTTTIEGETLMSTFDVVPRPSMPQFPILYQGAVRYRMDGEEAIGTMENTMPHGG
jgi:prepilin-type processing-associated H-X9-DG protein